MNFTITTTAKPFTSVMFTTANQRGETVGVTLALSTARAVLPTVSVDQAGDMQGMDFLKANLKAEVYEERYHLAHRRLIDLAIDAVEAGTLVAWTRV